MIKNIEERYNEMYDLYYNKHSITTEQWRDFCTSFLEVIMEENTDILLHLHKIQYCRKRYFEHNLL